MRSISVLVSMVVLLAFADLMNEGFLFSTLVTNSQLTSNFVYPRSALLRDSEFRQKSARYSLHSNDVFNINAATLDPATGTHFYFN